VGADAAVVVTPYYYQTTQSGIREFFQNIASRAPLPIVLYSIPTLTNNRLTVETVGTLANHDNIIGIKDSSGDIKFLSRVLDETPGGFSVLQGNAGLGMAAMDLGVDGLIASYGNLIPSIFSRLYRYHIHNDRKTAIDILNEIVFPLITTVHSMPFSPALKYYLTSEGIDVGGAIPPLPKLSESQKKTIDTCRSKVNEAVANLDMSQ